MSQHTLAIIIVVLWVSSLLAAFVEGAAGIRKPGKVYWNLPSTYIGLVRELATVVLVIWVLVG